MIDMCVFSIGRSRYSVPVWSVEEIFRPVKSLVFQDLISEWLGLSICAVVLLLSLICGDALTGRRRVRACRID